MKRFAFCFLMTFVFSSPSIGQYVNAPNGQIYNARITKTPYGIINYAGTALAADSAVVIMPDTTFAGTTTAGGTAFREIWVDLDDGTACWDLARFRQLEKLTSWYAASGPFPTRAAIRITLSAQDSVLIVDRQKGTTWMVFRSSGTDLMLYGAPPFTDLKFRDMKLYVGLTGAGFNLVDFLSDRGLRYATNGVHKFTGNIASRNTAGTWFALNSSPSIVHNTVNAIDVIRDPLGAVDEFGRPKHRVAVATAGGVSVSDAGMANFYDSADTNPFVDISLGPDGTLAAIANFTYDYLELGKRIQTISADAFALGRGAATSWRNIADGSQKIPFADATVFNGIKTFPNTSVSGPSEVFAIGTSAGLLVSNTNSGAETSGLTFSIDATRSAPGWSATADSLGWSFESTADTNNVWGKKLTRAGTGAGVSYGAGVIGQAATLDGSVNGFFQRNNDQSFRRGTAAWSEHIWVKSASASNPAGLEYLVNLRTTNDDIEIYFNTSGQLVARTSDDGASTFDTSTFAVDIYDALWHHIVYVNDTANFRLYVDGELVVTTALSAVNTSLDPDTLRVGANTGGTLRFSGSVDQQASIRRALTASEIRWLYNQGVRGQQSNVDPNDGLDTLYVAGVAVDPRGLWTATWGSGNGTRDSVTIWDQYMIPKYRYGSPGGNVKSVALVSSAGGDSLSVGISTTTKIQWRQTDPRISELAGGGRPTYPDHEGWARHVTTPRDSGTWVEGGVTVSSADSLARFKYTDPSNPGDLRVGRNAEFRGAIRYGSASTVGADLAEVLSGGPNIWKVNSISRVASGPTTTLPPLARLDSVYVVRDNDSTRTYACSVPNLRTSPNQPQVLIGSWLKSGKSKSTISDTVKVFGCEAGDTLTFASADSTIKRTVVSVSNDTVKLSGQIWANKKFKVYPPGLSIKYFSPNISIGDVCVIAPTPKTVRRSGLTDIGKRGWVASSNPGMILGAGIIDGIPLALAGTVPALVSADSGAVAVGDPLMTGTAGRFVKRKTANQIISAYALEAVAAGANVISVIVGP